MKINIVYKNANMPSEVLPGIRYQGCDIIWSKKVQPGQDVVVYFNHYAYDSLEHARVAKGVPKFLYMYEPLAVDAPQYLKTVWRQFDAALTWNHLLSGRDNGFFYECPHVHYSLPYLPADAPYGIQTYGGPSLDERVEGVCQIVGDKYSLMPEALYGERRRIARWFWEHSEMPFVTYGTPAMRVPGHGGSVPNKRAILERFQFSLCLDNTMHGYWTAGYLSEKMLDCLFTRTIPIYMGDCFMSWEVPAGCFIDYRKFRDPQLLEVYLQDEPTSTWEYMLEEAERYLAETSVIYNHSVERLYCAVMKLMWQGWAEDPDYGPDYWDYANLRGKAAVLATKALLPFHKHAYKAFHVARRVLP